MKFSVVVLAVALLHNSNGVQGRVSVDSDAPNKFVTWLSRFLPVDNSCDSIVNHKECNERADCHWWSDVGPTGECGIPAPIEEPPPPEPERMPPIQNASVDSTTDTADEEGFVEGPSLLQDILQSHQIEGPVCGRPKFPGVCRLPANLPPPPSVVCDAGACRYDNLCLAAAAGINVEYCVEDPDVQLDIQMPPIGVDGGVGGVDGPPIGGPGGPPIGGPIGHHQMAGVAWRRCIDEGVLYCSNHGYDEETDCYPLCDSCPNGSKECAWSGYSFCKMQRSNGDLFCEMPEMSCDESSCQADGGTCVGMDDALCGTRVCKDTGIDGTLDVQTADCDLDTTCDGDNDCRGGYCVNKYAYCGIAF